MWAQPGQARHLTKTPPQQLWRPAGRWRQDKARGPRETPAEAVQAAVSPRVQALVKVPPEGPPLGEPGE